MLNKKNTCNPNTTNQNIHAYGALLLAVLTAALLIIYNCSDQVLSTRERRQAKKREAAAKHVRETAQARERWKSAKDVAKKGAAGLQQSFSRTFSRIKSTQPIGLKNFGTKTNTSDATVPSFPLDSVNEDSRTKKEPGKLTQMMNSIEDDPNSHQGFHLNIGNKHNKKQAAKDLHTKSQIFKYAYGQIEKEKAMQDANKNLTFSGVISMASGDDIRKRPPIEVAFKDLTLTLKGKNKHVLRCMSGKISPGRVSAVMGPSGAGKTTFLSTIAGKARGYGKSKTSEALLFEYRPIDIKRPHSMTILQKRHKHGPSGEDLQKLGERKREKR